MVETMIPVAKTIEKHRMLYAYCEHCHADLQKLGMIVKEAIIKSAVAAVGPIGVTESKYGELPEQVQRSFVMNDFIIRDLVNMTESNMTTLCIPEGDMVLRACFRDLCNQSFDRSGKTFFALFLPCYYYLLLLLLSIYE
jgi:hypothetical protein